MLDKIFQSIDQKVKKEIENILQDKEEKILAMEKKHILQLEEKKQSERAAMEKKMGREVVEARKKFEQEFNFQSQTAKSQILERVYQSAAERFNLLNEAKLRTVIGKMVKVLPCDNQAILKAGPKTAKILSEKFKGGPEKIKGDLKEEGFIFVSPTLEIDMRFSQVLQQNREKTDPEILEILFS